MSWSPKYQIRNALLLTIREIGETLGAINAAHLSEPALAKLALEAKALSTYASTSIEGNPLPLTDVKRLLKNAPARTRDTEREILNYNKALQWVYDQVTAQKFEISMASFSYIQSMVVDGLMDSDYDIGNIRKKPVVIRDPRKPDNIVFMPPDHGDVQSVLDALMAFIRANLNALEPILLAGLFHKQAVIIHPFMDGNGRSTRLMTTAILGMAGIDIFRILSFEAYYNRNVTRYFQMVGENGDYYDLKDDTDFTQWLEYFAEGILDELKRVQKSLPKQAPRLEAHHQAILDYIEEHGSINQSEYGAISNRSLAARKKDFARLVQLGLIEAVGGGRSQYYILS